MSRCDCAAKDYAYCEECQPHRFEPAPLPSSGDDAGDTEEDRAAAHALMGKLDDDTCDEGCEEPPVTKHCRHCRHISQAIANARAAGRAAAFREAEDISRSIARDNPRRLGVYIADAIAARAGGTK